MGADQAEQRGGPIGGALRGAADQLRQLLQLDQRLALHDPLGTVGQVDVAAARCSSCRASRSVTPGKTVLRRISSWPGRTSLEQLGHRAIELADRRIEVLVHRRADGDDDGGGVFEHGSVGGRLEQAGLDCLRKQKSSASSSWKGIRPRLTMGHALGAGVEQIDLVALAGEGQAQGQADVAAAADDGQGAVFQTRIGPNFRADDRLQARTGRRLVAAPNQKRS